MRRWRTSPHAPIASTAFWAFFAFGSTQRPPSHMSGTSPNLSSSWSSAPTKSCRICHYRTNPYLTAAAKDGVLPLLLEAPKRLHALSPLFSMPPRFPRPRSAGRQGLDARARLRRARAEEDFRQFVADAHREVQRDGGRADQNRPVFPRASNLREEVAAIDEQASDHCRSRSARRDGMIQTLALNLC